MAVKQREERCLNSRSIWTMLLVIWFGFRWSCEEQALELQGFSDSPIPLDVKLKDLYVDEPVKHSELCH